MTAVRVAAASAIVMIVVPAVAASGTIVVRVAVASATIVVRVLVAVVSVIAMIAARVVVASVTIVARAPAVVSVIAMTVARVVVASVMTAVQGWQGRQAWSARPASLRRSWPSRAGRSRPLSPRPGEGLRSLVGLGSRPYSLKHAHDRTAP